MTKQAILITRDHMEAELVATPLNIAGLTTRRVTTPEEALRNWPEQPADLIVVGLDSEEPRPSGSPLRAAGPS